MWNVLLPVLFVVLGVVGYILYQQRAEQLQYEEYNREYNLTPKQLAAYNGKQHKRTFIGVRGDIFEVTGSPFYTGGGSYSVFAGTDASAALAKGDLSGDWVNKPIAGLDEEELAALEDWHQRFLAKYRRVGKVLPEASST